MNRHQKGVWLFGKGRLAIYTAELIQSMPDLYLRGVIPVAKEPEWDVSLRLWSELQKIPVFTLEAWRKKELLPEDIGISVYFDKLFTPSDLQSLALILNLHNSPLPKYRGVRPINWALENGETVHGVTLHKIDRGIDTGPILGQITFPIFPRSQEVRDVYDTCLELAKILIRDCLKFSGLMDLQKQDEDNASYYSKADSNRLSSRSDWQRKS